MRVATFNIENFFTRVRALNALDSAENKQVMEDVVRLQELIAKESYSAADKAEMKTILERNNVEQPAKRNFFIQEIRGRLYTAAKHHPAGKTVISQIKANGRGEWTGWIEFDREVFDSKAVENTARVISEINADVVCLVEVESRPAIVEFNKRFLKGAHRYSYKLLIDGNDPRGIDVALFSRYELRNLRSHVEDKIDNHEIFSRDCAEYQVILPSGKSLWILCNHFKSRGYGNPADNDAKRLKQSNRVREILKRFDLKKDLVIVAGDFNEVPDSPSLAPLLQHSSHLRNAFAKLPGDADQWTHKDDVSKNKQIDYILLSDPLFAACQKVEIERRGIYSKTDFKGKYPHFTTVTSESNQASDHAAVWADVAL
jgi:endonuclease/exonuclease/phosphatase family metal-dependent hydrolase